MEDLEKYCSENEPNEVLTDKVGRWINKVWQLKNSKIVESYTYNYDEITLLQNKDSQKVISKISEKALRYDLTVPFARYVVQHQNGGFSFSKLTVFQNSSLLCVVSCLISQFE